MPEVHAKLSASGAKRWMACPRSVALEAKFEEKSSDFAEEGTQAHAMAESLLNYRLHPDKDFAVRAFAEFQKIYKEKDPEMFGYVMQYVEYCLDIYDQACLKEEDALACVEERLDFSHIVPEGFGTGDFSVYTNDTLDIIDLKYGKGVKVEAVDNPQLRLYAIGAIKTIGWVYDIKKVRTHIVQPRLNHIDTEELTIDELMQWANDKVKPAARLAYNDEGQYNPTPEGCKFCKAKSICRARAAHYINTISTIIGGPNND